MSHRPEPLRTTLASETAKATSDIAAHIEAIRNVGPAAAGAEQIADNIAGVADASQRTTDGVGHAQTAADELARMSSDLQQIVVRFQLV